MIELLNKYNKRPLATDKNTIHSYDILYENIFNKYKEASNILEIGVAGGAFTCVLEEFFTNAIIHGIDIDTDHILYGKDKERIKYFKLNGADDQTPGILNTYYDVIIEDGSHIVQEQIKTLDVFAPYLKKGGMYVIEDIHQEGLKTILKQSAEKHDLRMEWYDLRKIKNRYDDILAIFYKD